MGLKDAWNAQMERSRNHKANVKAGVDGAYRLTSYVTDGECMALGVKRRVAGASAEFERGSTHNSATLTRVAAGALLAGPAGAIVGGLFKKDKSRIYVVVTFPDGESAIIDGPVSDERDLRSYTQIINRAGAHFTE